MTTVIVQQPSKLVQNNSWSSGICDCGQDMNSCCYAFWCFPCYTCSTTKEFGESPCLPLLDIFGPCLLASFGIVTCVPPVTLGMRVAVRYKYDIRGTLCEDIVLSCCCIWCSWCQMNREIKAHNNNIKMYHTVPTMVQQVPVGTTTQIVSTQQSVGVVSVAPVAAAGEIQMEPIQMDPPMVTKVVS